ncbi:MAG: cupin domain-containing protein [Rhodospirillaceae bacterium]|nr:cupin domain-containing protein [Rhodospirillaceae bacterium]
MAPDTTQPSGAPLDGSPALNPTSEAQHRARYFNPNTAFNLKFSPVPRHQFLEEHRAVRAADAPTGAFALDLSERMDIPFPATTPWVLARYLRINAGDRLTTNHRASAEVLYAVSGSGEAKSGSETISFGPGDVFCLPNGEIEYTSPDGAILWCVTNEPELAFENLEPPAAGNSPVEPVHYPADEIDRAIEVLRAMPMEPDQAGVAVIFSHERQLARRNITPSMTLAMNTLNPNGDQRAHKHNSVAVTICVQGEGCYSLVDGERCDWVEGAVSLTPPAAVHSHHNDGSNLAKFLIIQDGGLYYHGRTMGFAFVD